VFFQLVRAMLTAGNREAVHDGIRQGWEAFRTLQGNPTIDVLRYEVSGDSDVEVLEGSGTLVLGLGSIDAAAFPRTRKRKAVRGLIEYEEADIVFVVYNVEILLTDLIQYQNRKYQVIQASYNADSGRCVTSGSKV